MTFDREKFRTALAAELRAEKAAGEFTNGDLAERLQLTERTVRRYMKGERSVDSDDLALFAQAFGVAPGELFSRAMKRVEGL